VEGLTSKPQQLSELVLSLDEAYSKFLASQVSKHVTCYVVMLHVLPFGMFCHMCSRHVCQFLWFERCSWCSAWTRPIADSWPAR
jgi:hypothetical protein